MACVLKELKSVPEEQVRNLQDNSEFTEIEAWVLLTFFLSLNNQLMSVIMPHIKEYRCLKYVIHQIDRNEWLLVSAFQQDLRQNLSGFLS